MTTPANGFAEAPSLLRCTGGASIADEAYNSVRDHLERALAAGHSVDLSTIHGNALQPLRHYAVVWCPWLCNRAAELKLLGFKEGCVDSAVAMSDSREQNMTWYAPTIMMPQLFRLVRIEDATGVSGVGHIADGVLWHTGKCVLHWRTAVASVGLYDSLEELEAIHGHGGLTKVEWYPEMYRDAQGRLVERSCGTQLGEAFAVPVRRALERL